MTLDKKKIFFIYTARTKGQAPYLETRGRLGTDLRIPKPPRTGNPLSPQQQEGLLVGGPGQDQQDLPQDGHGGALQFFPADFFVGVRCL